MKDLVVGFAVIAVCVYICMLPWITLFRICMVLSKILKWIGLKFIDLAGFFFRMAWGFSKKHKKRNKKPSDKEQFGDSLEF
tara:strand:+ start:170 stop:412 length:243 start_codon:yes stop_codon:yes gene_type:complete